MAFTLIELLAVIVIMAILIGLILGAAEYAKRAAREKRARAEIERMHGFIQECQMKSGAIPLSLTNIVPMMHDGFMVETNWPLDPWRTPYCYVLASTKESYRLFSKGADTNAATADDIESGN